VQRRLEELEDDERMVVPPSGVHAEYAWEESDREGVQPGSVRHGEEIAAAEARAFGTGMHCMRLPASYEVVDAELHAILLALQQVRRWLPSGRCAIVVREPEGWSVGRQGCPACCSRKRGWHSWSEKVCDACWPATCEQRGTIAGCSGEGARRAAR